MRRAFLCPAVAAITAVVAAAAPPPCSASSPSQAAAPNSSSIRGYRRRWGARQSLCRRRQYSPFSTSIPTSGDGHSRTSAARCDTPAASRAQCRRSNRTAHDAAIASTPGPSSAHQRGRRSSARSAASPSAAMPLRASAHATRHSAAAENPRASYRCRSGPTAARRRRRFAGYDRAHSPATTQCTLFTAGRADAPSSSEGSNDLLLSAPSPSADAARGGSVHTSTSTSTSPCGDTAATTSEWNSAAASAGDRGGLAASRCRRSTACARRAQHASFVSTLPADVRPAHHTSVPSSPSVSAAASTEASSPPPQPPSLLSRAKASIVRGTASAAGTRSSASAVTYAKRCTGRRAATSTYVSCASSTRSAQRLLPRCSPRCRCCRPPRATPLRKWTNAASLKCTPPSSCPPVAAAASAAARRRVARRSARVVRAASSAECTPSSRWLRKRCPSSSERLATTASGVAAALPPPPPLPSQSPPPPPSPSSGRIRARLAPSIGMYSTSTSVLRAPHPSSPRSTCVRCTSSPAVHGSAAPRAASARRPPTATGASQAPCARTIAFSERFTSSLPAKSPRSMARWHAQATCAFVRRSPQPFTTEKVPSPHLPPLLRSSTEEGRRSAAGARVGPDIGLS
eukprot:Rhum_TRINITY_DN13065_c0_g1::Rhum_TRINITY_DN13065_c0_g1_i1::g.56632::m.56632